MSASLIKNKKDSEVDIYFVTPCEFLIDKINHIHYKNYNP